MHDINVIPVCVQVYISLYLATVYSVQIAIKLQQLTNCTFKLEQCN